MDVNVFYTIKSPDSRVTFVSYAAGVAGSREIFSYLRLDLHMGVRDVFVRRLCWASD